MLQFDPATGLLSLPIWVSATVAAVLVVLAILALARSGTFKTLFALLAFGVVGYGGWMGWQMFERIGEQRACRGTARVRPARGRTCRPRHGAGIAAELPRRRGD